MKKLYCKKCFCFLGEMEKGKLHKKAILLCDGCWAKADIAMKIAEMTRNQSNDFLRGDNNLQDLMGRLGMK